MTKQEKFAVVMQTLAETYRQQVTPLMLEGYWSALGDLDEAELAAATKLSLKLCKFMPTPADIRGFVREVRANRLATATTLLLEAQRDCVPATREQLEELRQRS